MIRSFCRVLIPTLLRDAAFTYDSNGNITADAVRGLTRVRYNRLNLPCELTFTNGQRQTITYDFCTLTQILRLLRCF